MKQRKVENGRRVALYTSEGEYPRKVRKCPPPVGLHGVLRVLCEPFAAIRSVRVGRYSNRGEEMGYLVVFTHQGEIPDYEIRIFEITLNRLMRDLSRNLRLHFCPHESLESEGWRSCTNLLLRNGPGVRRAA